jgi:pseudouridine synthase
MQERLQKIIARAGIASRRHAEQLILSGQVRVNGRVVTELGTKADLAKDRIEAAGRAVREEERKVSLLLHKPAQVLATMADPEGRKTLRHCLRGMGARVYPVGRLDYDASGLVFLTNDGDLAAEMLRGWSRLPQMYYVKVKGRLPDDAIISVAEKSGVRLRAIRQPGASRGRDANMWYEVTLKDSKRDVLRKILLAAEHPVEKFKRIAIGPLTLEGLPQGRYRVLDKTEVEGLRRVLRGPAVNPARERKTSEEAHPAP